MPTKESKDIVINITSGTIFKTVLIFLLFYALYLLSDLLLVILTSIVVASSIEPAAKWFIARKVPRTLAVLVVYVAFFGGFAWVFYNLIPLLIEDFSQFASSLPSYFDFLQKWNPLLGALDYDTVLRTLSSKFAFGESSDGNVAQAVWRILQSFLNFILVLVLSFYFAVQERGIENFLKIIVPDKNEKYIIDLWYRSQKKIGLWMQGQLLLGVLVGALVYLGLLILGVKHAFMLAIVAAILELIPVFGPTLSAIPAVMIGFTMSAFTGFSTIGLYLVVQQFENHLIYPVVVRKVVGVPPILVIVSLIIGATLGGFMGLILSVPLSAAIMEFVGDIEKKRFENAAKS